MVRELVYGRAAAGQGRRARRQRRHLLSGHQLGRGLRPLAQHGGLVVRGRE
jgi:hypothetical protein